ncbi:TetR family transcriptional regulator [Natranaerovirga hydrolytica]|uniref:TetR family transcriptional regulator n=1 Tax=Natranaerovirga hydrolytica TaxID=680378 RepID=A0A4R1MPY1_9FIRM|nr:TetR family transcriptional regulator [Natranaerovirga hydrolytica]TCK92569.1 TetR family transcriptional regulator [Natranaerovirga hydrolytica]
MNQSLDVKKNIQKAAKRLFALNGYNATSTRDIVREAGVNISAIAYHFGSKEGLFLSLFNDFLFLDDEASVFVGNPVLELKKLLTWIISLRFEDPELVTILQQEIVVHSTRTEAVKERLVPIWQRIHLLLEQGKEAGYFQFHSVYNALNFVMSAAVFPWQNPFFRDVVDRNELEEAVIAEMIGLILKGLGWKDSK